MENKEQILSRFSSFPKNDQIEIILNGFFDDRVKINNPEIPIYWSDIAKGFTVTEDDILEYFQQHKDIKQFSFTKDDSHEGIYIIEEEGKYKYFNQERGVRLREKTFDSYDEALMDLINDKIKFYLELRHK